MMVGMESTTRTIRANEARRAKAARRRAADPVALARAIHTVRAGIELGLTDVEELTR